MPTLPGARDYKWILALPLSDRPGGATIGVVGFASENTQTRAGRALAAFARQTARRGWLASDVDFNLLWAWINVGFWKGMRLVLREGTPPLDDRALRRMIEACAIAWGLDDDADE